MNDYYQLPMFPLGSVVFPQMILPLHVFEDRYRELVEECLAGDSVFGTCLIERGSEVGGGDTRSDTGTLLRIVDAQQMPDGRYGIVSIAIGRCEISEWLPDDPYPMAMVAEWPDQAPIEGFSSELESFVSSLRQFLARAVEMGVDWGPATFTVPPDPSLATWFLASQLPVGPLDRLEILRTPGPSQRVRLLARLLDEQFSMLERQIELFESGDEADEGPDLP